MQNSLIKVGGRNIAVEGRLIRIARLDGDKYKFLDDPQALLTGLRGSGVRADLFTFMQRVPETAPKFHYPVEFDNLAVLPVSTFDHWWTHQIGSYPRNRARQAEKRGATLREVPFDDTLVQGIWSIYNECPIRQGKPFPHYGKDVETIRKMTATYLDSSIFLGAFYDEKLIGFAKLVADDTWTQANLMHILSLAGHKDKAPTNALVAEAVRSCAARGIQYLVYQNFSYGRKKADGLTHFKQVNGFQRVDLPRYHVPLTRIGSAALRLGLHHRRLVDYLPEPAIAKLQELRSAWYARKLRTSSEVY